MRLFDSKYQRAAALILLLGALLIIALLPFTTGLIAIPVLFVIFEPIYRVLVPPLRPSLAAGLVVALALLILVAAGLLVTGVVVNEAPGIARGVLHGPLLARLSAVHFGSYDLGPQLAKMSESVVSWVGSSALLLIGTATRLSLNLTISLFGLYYLLIWSEETWAAVEPYIPFSPANTSILRQRFTDVTVSTVIGTGLTALLQGTLVGVGFLMVGLANPLFWGLVTAIFSVLPVVGSGLVWVPGVVLLALEARYGAAIGLAAWSIFLVANVDNVIRPIVFSRWAKIHPLVTLIGAFAGIRYFGLLGILVGPLALSYFFELIRMYREEYILRRRRRSGAVSQVTEETVIPSDARTERPAPPTPAGASPSAHSPGSMQPSQPPHT